MRAVTAAAKVLVVEDDEAIGRSLEGVLLERGYAVERCLRGGDALLAADAFRPDLVLLDLGLPDLDGIEVCRRLRLGSPLLPIVMLTARGEEMDVVLGLSAGADDYVAKPFRLNELLARVAAQLRRSEGAAGAHVRSRTSSSTPARGRCGAATPPSSCGRGSSTCCCCWRRTPAAS